MACRGLGGLLRSGRLGHPLRSGRLVRPFHTNDIELQLRDNGKPYHDLSGIPFGNDARLGYIEEFRGLDAQLYVGEDNRIVGGYRATQSVDSDDIAVGVHPGARCRNDHSKFACLPGYP